MTIATDLRSALAPTLQILVEQFGVPTTLRRPDSSTRSADGFDVTITPAVGGAPAPSRILIVSGKRVDVQKAWGQETEAELVALCRDNVPVQSKDLLEILSGSWASSTMHYQVNELEPVDAGGFWLLGLTKVPALPAS